MRCGHFSRGRLFSEFAPSVSPAATTHSLDKTANCPDQSPIEAFGSSYGRRNESTGMRVAVAARGGRIGRGRVPHLAGALGCAPLVRAQSGVRRESAMERG